MIPTWVDPEFKGELRDSVLDALTEWNTVLNGIARFEVTDSAELEMRRNRNELLLSVQKNSVGDMSAGILGWWDPQDPKSIHIVGDQLNVPADGMRTVVEHEIGHYLGLGHIDAKGTLMYPGWTLQGNCIDHVTVAALAIEHGWNDMYLNYCTR